MEIELPLLFLLKMDLDLTKAIIPTRNVTIMFKNKQIETNFRWHYQKENEKEIQTNYLTFHI